MTKKKEKETPPKKPANKKAPEETTIDDVFESTKAIYDKGAAVNMGEHRAVLHKRVLDHPSLQYVTDGGIPRGRITYIGGEESAGKSTLAVQIATKIAKKKILLGDSEFTHTSEYIEDLGGDPNRWVRIKDNNVETMFDRFREELETGEYDVAIIDSINNMVSYEELKKDAAGKSRAQLAHIMTTQLKILIGICDRLGIDLFILTQLRVNQTKNGPYDKDYVFPNIMILKHNATLQLELTPRTKKKESEKNTDLMELYDTVSGQMITIASLKNKGGKRYRAVQMQFDYGKGFTLEADISNSAVRLGIVTKAGSWLKYNGETICQGQDSLPQLLRDNEELAQEILTKINEKISGVSTGEVLEEFEKYQPEVVEEEANE